MERNTLSQILSSTDGIDGSNADFTVPETHRVTVYIARDGHSMTVADVAAFTLLDGYVRAETRDGKGFVFFEYTSVSAVAVRPPASRDERRAGFS